MKILKERIEEITTLIAEVANGNFDYTIEASETGDELDAIIYGVNMLGQELKSSTVSRDFMQSIYKGVVDMLLVLNNDFTIRNVNEAFEELVGYREEELKGHSFAELVLDHDKPALRKALDDFKNQSVCLNVELSFVAKQEHIVPTSSSFSYLVSNNRTADGILIIAKDITKIKEKEHELEEAKNEAEAANEAKSSFLSSMSHEIRTPLHGIMGFTDLLMGTGLSEKQAQYVRLIKASGATLSKLLNDILDLHRIESNKVSLEAISFHVRETISSHLEPYKYQAQNKGLAFSYTFDESLPLFALGDPTRISQVLINLVSNAIKFTESGSIAVHLCAERAEDNGAFTLKCTITDTGPGIPTGKQELIFDSFTQSDQSTARNYGGSGLGLSISRKLVSLMRGELGVISPLPGQVSGSCFWFALPLNVLGEQEDAGAGPDGDAAFKLQEGTRILVVDDNAINVMLMEDVLENLGATVSTAQSGKEAVELAKTQSFDLIVMDIQMPEMDGLEATALLRKMSFDAPIIAFSANAYADDIKRSLAVGMNDHLCKPFERDDLISLLRKWM